MIDVEFVDAKVPSRARWLMLAAMLGEAFRQGRFPAQQALAALESVVVRGIALDAISIAGSSVQVELRAMNEPTLREYLDHLNAGLPHQVWSIASASTAGEQSPLSLRVRLVSNWAD